MKPRALRPITRRSVPFAATLCAATAALIALSTLGLAGCTDKADSPAGPENWEIQRTVFDDTTTTADHFIATPLSRDGGFAAIWQTQGMEYPYANGIRFADLDSNGTFLSSRGINASESILFLDPALSPLPGGGCVAAWISRGPSDDQGHVSVLFLGHRFDTPDVPLKIELPGFLYPFGVSVLGLPDAGFLLAVSGYDSIGEACIRVRRFDAGGAPLGSILRIFDGAETGKPGLIDRPGGGWMLAWQGHQAGNERTLNWQPFDSLGRPLAEPRIKPVDQWQYRLRLTRFPGDRIYVDLAGSDPGMVLDAMGAPDPKFDTIARYRTSLVEDPIRSRYYAVESQYLVSLDSTGQSKAAHSLQSSSSLAGGEVYLNRKGEPVLFNLGRVPYGSGGKQRNFIQVQLFRPF